MATRSKDYRYSVEFNIHAVDAPGTRLIKTGDIYLNICLLGMHKRTRLMPPFLPMHVDQKLFFDKVFKFCNDAEEVVERLDREHVLIELIQNDIPYPILLASYETTAKQFLYPYSSARIEYTGLRRYVLLERTIDFPGISPNFEFSTSPMIDDVTDLTLPIAKPYSGVIVPVKRSASPTWTSRARLYNSANSVASHTISSAIKNDHGQRDTREKLSELKVDQSINYVTPVDKTNRRPPFVVRHVTNDLIGRKPKSHTIFKDPLVINNYTFSRPVTASLSSFEHDSNCFQPRSAVLTRSLSARGRRARSQSPTRRTADLTQSLNIENSPRSSSPPRDVYGSYYDEFGNDDIYGVSPPRHLMSPTLLRDSFRYRYRHSPATDLSDKVIQTLRRNLDSYSIAPSPRYYTTYPYVD